VADPHHYTVALENDHVRVLKISYGPYETGVMHSHPDSVLVCLTEMNGTMTYPDGRAEDMLVPAGVAAFMPANAHQPASTTANRFEGYLIELKD
jgi:quercetin dioxygenase-like cupin family protein